MSDIVERLREVAAMDLRTGPILAHTLDTAKEAACEIERLDAVVLKQAGEIGRLRIEVEQWRENDRMQREILAGAVP